MIQRRTFVAAASAALSPALRAQTESRPVVPALRILVGFPAGGSADALARRVGDHLQGRYATTVLVENKTGASGRLAIGELKRSRPDGATMLLTPSTTIALYPRLYDNIAYQPEDFIPVSTAAWIQSGLGVGPGVPDSVRDLPAYLNWVKQNPGQGGYASPAAGSMPHIVGMLLARQTGTPLNHIPYRGSAPAMADLLGGQVPAYCGPVGDWVPHLKTGKLRLLATSGKQRSQFAPGVPTFAELGHGELVMSQWQGFFLPRGVPAGQVQALGQMVAEAIRLPAVAASIEQMGMEPGSTSPKETLALLQNDHARWGAAVKQLHIKLED